MVPTLLILSALVFLSVRFIPGDIIDALESRMDYLAAPLDREQLERVLGLDAPIHVQYVRWSATSWTLVGDQHVVAGRVQLLAVAVPGEVGGAGQRRPPGTPPTRSAGPRPCSRPTR